MNEAVEDIYFNWLCAKVEHVENPTPSLTHWKLLKKLHHTKFVWILSGDDNRAQDGVDLRYVFLTEAGIDVDPEWYEIDCSMLEMLIAFAKRLEWQTDYSQKHWFWMMLGNLDIQDLNDAKFNRRAEEIVDEILDSFIWRTYDYNGLGGLFPLREPEHDQTGVEIWYQFCEYLIEQD